MTSGRLAPGSTLNKPDFELYLGVNLEDDVPCDVKDVYGLSVSLPDGRSYFADVQETGSCNRPAVARILIRCPQCLAETYRFMCALHLKKAYNEELVCRTCDFVGIQVVGET